MGASAFANCKAMTTASIGDGIRVVGNYAFSGCVNLAKVRLGALVVKIGTRSFYYCSSLRTITSYNTEVPSIETETFSSFLATLSVPASSVDAYKGDKIWGKFASVEAIIQPVYLTIKQGAGRVVKVKVNVGEAYTCYIQPSESAKIISVTFNGTDITSQLVDNSFLTPAITESSELIVNYDSDEFKKGDMNGDNKLDAADVVLLVDKVMSKE
jgi:hypothetical protein